MQLVPICKTALDVIEGEGPLSVPRDLHPLPGAEITVNLAACGFDLRLHCLDFSIEIERVFVGMLPDFLQTALQLYNRFLEVEGLRLLHVYSVMVTGVLPLTRLLNSSASLAEMPSPSGGGRRGGHAGGCC